MHLSTWTRQKFLMAAAASAGLLALPGYGGNSADSIQNAYRQENLAASSAAYAARFTFPGMVNAWGIAIRPHGAGGHFWVTGGGISWEFVGDVKSSSSQTLRTLFQDELTQVSIPGADALTDETSLGKATATVFNGAPLDSPLFRVAAQTAISDGRVTAFDGSARFIFATDSGHVTAWRERTTEGTVERVNGPSQDMFDGSAQQMAFFGMAIKPDTWDRLWLADFGAEPQIRTLDANALLTGNFGGNGTIAAFDRTSGRFIDFMRTATSRPIAIPGLWALLFGNGESLGDSNALYFAAGPNDEKDGLFGSLRYALA
ncbi:MAG: hypothetical protein JWQ00_433 [Noviherbaspirillum sp.]|nr:hypothetical protein [Noviherbaspirillum sp.]